MINIRSKIDNLTYHLPILMSFSIPISTALTNVCVALLLICYLFDGNLKAKLNQYWEHPLSPILLGIFLWYLVGALYSPAGQDHILERLSDGFRLTLIPMLAYYLISRTQLIHSLYAFILAMCITLILACLKVYFGLPIGLKYTQAAVFKTHIDTNFFMCLSAFYVFFLSFNSKKYRNYLIAVGLCMLYYMFFMSIGRIGYISFFVIGAYLGHHFWGKKGLGIALGVLAVSAIGIYHLSDIFAQRLDILSQDWQYYQQGRLLESSIGSRLHFYLSSWDLITQKPLLGWGTGSFGYAYEILNQGQFLTTDNPHNEYLRIGVESGFIGLGLLLLLFIRQWQLYDEVPEHLRILARGSLMLFLIGCIVNSWLIDFSESYFYVVLTAMSLSTIKSYRPGDLVEAPLH